MVIAFVMASSLSFAGETEISMAKKDLYEDISERFKEDISHWNNYFFKKDINSMDEKVEISFYVNDDQSLSVFRVRCENADACGYVKHVFRENKMFADEVLAGKAYTFKLHLIYKTR
jgi:hypothetical protein